MAITIYTYKNPYDITKESYWGSISNCPHYCASQTLVNGLNSVNKAAFQEYRLKTVRNLTDSLFVDWSSPYTTIKQLTQIDTIVQNDLYASDDLKESNMYKSFMFNSADVFKSIRALLELKVNVNQINLKEVSQEQKYIIEIYEKILEKPQVYKEFCLKDSFLDSEIDEAIKRSLADDRFDQSDIDNLDYSKIVIHGVHQFSPIILRTIEEIAKTKEVIMLFNYQTQYKNIYQTWIDIYSNFESKINISNNKEYHPVEGSYCYTSNVLADCLGTLCEGKRPDILPDKKVYLYEFDNVTEFANYVARQYDEGKENNPKNPLLGMNEVIYTADDSINEILKVYYPDQFGERKFLQYPLGHFFVAIANMWNPTTKRIEIEDINDVRECFLSNIIPEKEHGEISSVFERFIPVFDNCSSIDEMQSIVKIIKRNKNKLDIEEEKDIERLSYYNVTDEEIDVIYNALNELNNLANLFFDDFKRDGNDFKKFYNKLKSYLAEKAVEDDSIDQQFHDIIVRVLERLNEVNDITTSASFDCLKSTMQVYLQQVPADNSPNWIAKNFEQIDGDVLRSKTGKPKIYHFACLSDEDINAVNKRPFPWPLDANFFEVAQNPVDWKYQVYVEACQEYKNFRRYALLYGLEFNRNTVKLSYVKNGRNAQKEPLYLLKMLGIEPKKYRQNGKETGERKAFIINVETNEPSFDKYDFYKYKLCKYRFLLDSIVEGSSVYKDSFLQKLYFQILLEAETRNRLEGEIVTDSNILSYTEEVFDNYKKYFPFASNTDKADIINQVRSNIGHTFRGRIKKKSTNDIEKEEIKKQFIKDPKEDYLKTPKSVIDNELSKDKIDEMIFEKTRNKVCAFCANKDICLANSNK